MFGDLEDLGFYNEDRSIRKEFVLLYVIIIVLTLLLLFILISLKYQKVDFLELDKKKHPLRFLYPSVAFLQDKVLKKEVNLMKEERFYSYQKFSLTFLCLFSCLFLLFLYELQQLSKPPEIINDSIKKPKVFEGNKTVDAFYYLDSSKEEISFTVPETILLGEERTKLMEAAIAELDCLILGDNTSFEFITKDLYFPSRLMQNHIIVKYSIPSLDLVRYDGSIKSDNVSEEGNKVYVTASLQYDTAMTKKTYEFCLYPREVSSEKFLEEQIIQELEHAKELSKYDEVMFLPDQVGDQRVMWLNRNSKNTIYLFFGSLILVVMIPILFDRNKKEKEEKYQSLLLKDYPEIVSKFRLLLSAGMTTKGAWERIVLDYQKDKEEMLVRYKKSRKRFAKNRVDTYQKRKERPAYEQMLITKREQDNGLSEGVSYESFGKRCRSISYIRFGSLIAQNLKMGSKGLAQLLETEAKSAFEERKVQAKQLGEKASTKLLGPTIGMLVIILCIIMVPAFMSF